MRLTLATISLLFCLAVGSIAAPIQNGGFDGTGAPWGQSANSAVSFGGSATLSVVNIPAIPLVAGTTNSTNIVAAVNGATGFTSTALGSLTGVGSFVFQAFDRVSGNAGDVIEYTVNSLPGGGLNAFAYFLDVTSNFEQVVALTSTGTQTFHFTSGGTANLLVGFGVLRPAGTAGAFSLIVDSVNQVPEIDSSAAALPLAILCMAAFVAVDSRKRRAGTLAC